MSLFHRLRGNQKWILRREKRKKRKNQCIEIEKKCLMNIKKYMLKLWWKRDEEKEKHRREKCGRETN